MDDKMSVEEIKEYWGGKKTITGKKRSPLVCPTSIFPGDYIDTDRLHQSLLYAGLNAIYENEHGIVIFYIDGEEIGTQHRCGFDDPMVATWELIKECPEGCKCLDEDGEMIIE